MIKIIVTDEYSEVIERRNNWLFRLDKFLESSHMQFLKKSFLKDFPMDKPKRMTEKKYQVLREWHKVKFHKYQFILNRLKEEEKNDPFGFNDIKHRMKKANPYVLSAATLKSLLEDIKE